MKKNIVYAVILMGLICLFGCETFQEAWDDAISGKSAWGQTHEPRYLIGIYQIIKYPQGLNIESEINTLDGSSLYINTNQFFSSTNVKEIRLLPRVDRPGTYDIALNLDYQGELLWNVISNNFRHEKMVLLVDGVFLCTFTPEIMGEDSSGWVTITHPFDEVTANGLMKNSKPNYKYFQKK